MELRDIDRLAELSRLDISQEEKESLASDMDSILGYIDQIQSVSLFQEEGSATIGSLYNVMRDDTVTHETGEYTEAILAEVPDTKNGFVKVKQVFND
mgnify:FL=1